MHVVSLVNCMQFNFKKCENVVISIKGDFPKIAKITTQQKKTTVFYNRKN